MAASANCAAWALILVISLGRLRRPRTAMMATWWITVPGNDFRRRKSFIDLSATARFGRSISTTSVAIELDQPLVADPEVMRDLVEHDVPDLAA